MISNSVVSVTERPDANAKKRHHESHRLPTPPPKDAKRKRRLIRHTSIYLLGTDQTAWQNELEHEQGSLHYTPEHCLVNGGFPLFWWKKPCFKWAKCIF